MKKKLPQKTHGARKHPLRKHLSSIVIIGSFFLLLASFFVFKLNLYARYTTPRGGIVGGNGTCSSNYQCASNQICCTGNNIGSIACRGYANNTCEYAQCIGTFVDTCNSNHKYHLHTIVNHYCQYVDRCAYGACGAKCDATHHCANGKTCSSSCQCVTPDAPIQRFFRGGHWVW